MRCARISAHTSGAVEPQRMTKARDPLPRLSGSLCSSTLTRIDAAPARRRSRGANLSRHAQNAVRSCPHVYEKSGPNIKEIAHFFRMRSVQPQYIIWRVSIANTLGRFCDALKVSGCGGDLEAGRTV